MKRVDAAKYSDIDALLALGATAIFEVKDPGTDTVIAYDVDPDVDLRGYASAISSRLDVVKAGLKVQVDAQAEVIRLKLITPGSGQAMEYQEAYAEAQAVAAALAADADATFKPADYPMLAASIGYDIDPQTSTPTTDVPGEARAVLAAYEAYQVAGAAIRRARLKGKAEIDSARDAGEAQKAFDAIKWPDFG